MDIMIFFPFVVFFFIFIYNYSRRGLDVYSYLLLIYTFSAFFSIFVDGMDLYKDFNVFKHPLGLVAPISYCLLISICLYPYKKFNSSKIAVFEIVNLKRYHLVIWIFFVLSIIMMIVSATRLSDILINQSMAAVRDGFYHGNGEFIWSSYSGWFRYFMGVSSLLSATAYILILFFFYNLVVLRESLWFNFITLIGSISPLIQSVFIADRSGFVHWTLIFLLCYILFHKKMSSAIKKQFFFFGIVLVSLILFYVITVTVSRFGDDTGGDLNDIYSSLVYYIGSCYIQYCNFFNVLDYNSPFSLAPLFPLTYWLNGWPGYFEQCEAVEKVYHHGVSNFSTFLGMILSMSGRIIMCVFVMVYYTVSNKMVHRKDINYLSIKKMIYFFIVVLVVNNGLFGYFYMSYSSTCNIIIWIFLAYYLTNNQSSDHKVSLVNV